MCFQRVFELQERAIKVKEEKAQYTLLHKTIMHEA